MSSEALRLSSVSLISGKVACPFTSICDDDEGIQIQESNLACSGTQRGRFANYAFAVLVLLKHSTCLFSSSTKWSRNISHEENPPEISRLPTVCHREILLAVSTGLESSVRNVERGEKF